MEEKEERKKSLTVAVSEISPMVMKVGKKYTGFEIELWEKIAEEAGLDNYRYQSYKTIKGVLSAIVLKKADLALAGATINAQREKTVDFSHPTLDSGLRIMVRKDTKKSIFGTAKSFFGGETKRILTLFVTLFVFIFISGNAYWLAERRVSVSMNYFPGIFESLWWTLVSITSVGYGDYSPTTWLGRAVGVGVILAGVLFIGFLIAEFSSFLTLKGMKLHISEYGDLAGKDAATVDGTTSIDALARIGARITAVKDIKEAYSLLERGSVEAVVFDGPTLLYRIKSERKGKFRISGGLFDPQAYGIIFQQTSDIRETINRAMLRLKENGSYDQICRKWFGDRG